jgi:hypothetical protein
MAKHVLPGMALVFLCAAAGCGPATADITGAVIYKGKPVRMGTVMLLADGGSPLYAELKDDGGFALSSVPVGKVRMTVSSPDPARPILAKGETKPKKGLADPRWFAIPPKYADPGKSDLQYEVTRGKNTLEVVLKD